MDGVRDIFSKEEEWLIHLLRNALVKEGQTKMPEDIQKAEIAKLFHIAKKHAVSSLLYDRIREDEVLGKNCSLVEPEVRQVVMQSYRLLFLTKYIVGILEEAGIPVVVLKGVATASLYPVPETRKTGDVDLLVPDSIEAEKIKSIMMQAGFEMSKEQHANHHIAFVSDEGICIEIHTMLAEPFAYKRINQAMRGHMTECWQHIQRVSCMGVVLPILDKPFHAYELLLHMLQHFVHSGFGLKLLCDWVVLWNKDWTKEEMGRYESLLKESGLQRFSDVISAVCIRFLGLSMKNPVGADVGYETEENFMREILDAEEFGHSDQNRMVMMNGTGIGAYAREFHHQMQLNYPRAGRCFLLWPILWLSTLVKFLRNNQKVRNTSANKILKEASRRSGLMKELDLFRNIERRENL